MTIHFANRNNLDLSLLTVMGLSIKTTDSPIGYFGTGLKFAIATLLRTGHSVRLWTEGHWHTFSTKERVVRGEKIQLVCMDGEALSFALNLGRNWEPWQAYRELASNARDEPDCLITGSPIDPEAHDTCFVVEGEGIEKAHRERADIFCESRVLHRIDGVAEVREGQSHFIFYRGVRVWTMQKPSLWTWNFLSPIELTEDRTMKYLFQAHAPMGRMVARSNDVEFITSVLSAHDEVLERKADFDYVRDDETTEAFRQTTRAMAQTSAINHSARRLWARAAPTEDLFDDAILDEEDQAAIEEAEELVLTIDPDYAMEPRYVVTLGEGRYGLCRPNKDVLIAHATIDMGADFLAATLYEEYLHMQHGLEDCGRGMQNHIFQQLVRLARRVP